MSKSMSRSQMSFQQAQEIATATDKQAWLDIRIEGGESEGYRVTNMGKER